MGMTLKAIPFFADTIKVEVHTAGSITFPSHVSHPGDRFINRAVSLEEFAGRRRMSLYEIVETGELYARREDGIFIQGPEA